MSRPAGGYDFAAKEDYRRKLWTTVDQYLAKPRKHRTVVYLDTAEGLETRHLLSLGYNPALMHAVNRNPAEVAVLTRRLRVAGLPDVCTHGAEFRDVLPRVGHADVVNFDGTSTLNAPNNLELKWSALHVRAGGVLAMTFVAGREQGYERDVVHTLDWRSKRSSFGAEMRHTHQSRISLAWAAATTHDHCRVHIDRFKWEVYVSSSGLPILWTVGQLRPHTDEALRRWYKTQNMRRIGCEFPPACIAETAAYRAILKREFGDREDIRDLLLSEISHGAD